MPGRAGVVWRLPTQHGLHAGGIRRPILAPLSWSQRSGQAVVRQAHRPAQVPTASHILPRLANVCRTARCGDHTASANQGDREPGLPNENHHTPRPDYLDPARGLTGHMNRLTRAPVLTSDGAIRDLPPALAGPPPLAVPQVHIAGADPGQYDQITVVNLDFRAAVDESEAAQWQAWVVWRQQED